MSMIAILCPAPAPRAAGRMATLLKMQKPIAVAALAWCPGGRLSEKAWAERPSQTASTAVRAAPTDRTAAARDPGRQ